MFHLTLLLPRFLSNERESSNAFGNQRKLNSVVASVLLSRFYDSPSFSIEKFARESLNLLKLTQNESLIHALFASICRLLAEPALSEALKEELLEQLIVRATARASSTTHPLFLLDYLINRIFPLLYPPHSQGFSLLSSPKEGTAKGSIPLDDIKTLNQYFFSWFQTREPSLLRCMVDWFCAYPEALIHFMKQYGLGDLFTLVHLHFNESSRVLPTVHSILNENKELLQVFFLSEGGLWASHLLRKSLRSSSLIRDSIKGLIRLSKSKIKKGVATNSPLLTFKNARTTKVIPMVDGRALPVPKQKVPPQPRQSPVKPFFEPSTTPTDLDLLLSSSTFSEVEKEEESPSSEIGPELVQPTELTILTPMEAGQKKKRSISLETKEVVLTDLNLEKNPLPATTVDIPIIYEPPSSNTINLDLLRKENETSTSQAQLDALFSTSDTSAMSSFTPPSSAESIPLELPPVVSTEPILLPSPTDVSDTTSTFRPIVEEETPTTLTKLTEMKKEEKATTPDTPRVASTSMGVSEKCLEILTKIKQQASNWFIDLHAYWLEGLALHEAIEITKGLYALLQLTLPQLDPLLDPPTEDQSPSTPAHCLRCLYQCMIHPRLFILTKSNKPLANRPGKQTKWILDTSVPHKRPATLTTTMQCQDRLQSMLVEMGFLDLLVGALKDVFEMHALEYTCCCLQVLVHHPKNYFLPLLVPNETEESSNLLKLLITVRYSSNLGIQRNSRAVFHTLAKLDEAKDKALDILRGSIWEHVVN
ncbi:hypothetical protein HMI54_005107 [Coelomomyces lativittatus]|nr:hypothetical protein HMI56_006188 [Coelomomyces lativittatus]KAJ1512139.1 hypothetical protein HMI55_006338 [Coelomomyces lativittatus]KAJ1517591.1 hypothetical protein HMI54_005107 [Coelomomyces lativittatus]